MVLQAVQAGNNLWSSATATQSVSVRQSGSSIQIYWGNYGFLSGADPSQYATQDANAIEWMLVYTREATIEVPWFDEATGEVRPGGESDEVLSVRRWERGSDIVTVTDLVATSAPSDNPLGMDLEFAYISDGKAVYANYDFPYSGGGIYALVLQYLPDGRVYYAVTDLNTAINWNSNSMLVPDEVNFAMGKDVQIANYLGQIEGPVVLGYWLVWGDETFGSEEDFRDEWTDEWSSGNWHFGEVGETHSVNIYAPFCYPTNLEVALSLIPDDGTIGLSGKTAETVHDETCLVATFNMTLLRAPPDGGGTYTIKANPKEQGWRSLNHMVTVF